MAKARCLVCGNPLDYLPWNGDIPSEEICPCCGVQFGYDDFAGGKIDSRKARYEELRFVWIETDMKWFSDSTRPPQDWDPRRQLKALEQERG